MKDRKKAAPALKSYEQDQIPIIPPTAVELIPADHLARVIDATIDGLGLDELLATYEGGASSYNPAMLLKVLVNAYAQKVYSSRQVAKQVRENVVYLWLAGRNTPDFRTINNVRSSHLKQRIQDVFAEAAGILVEEGYGEVQGQAGGADPDDPRGSGSGDRADQRKAKGAPGGARGAQKEPRTAESPEGAVRRLTRTRPSWG